MWKYHENRFDLNVIGYQFCEAVGDRFDDNWLVVKIVTVHRNFEKITKC